MDQSTLGLVFLAAFALVVPSCMVLASWIAGRPRTKSRTDTTPYECGKKPFESARRPFSVKFYLVAMLFIIFDIEAAFLYPWAVALKQHGITVSSTFVVVEMLVFVGILVAGFAYVWFRGALDWDR